MFKTYWNIHIQNEPKDTIYTSTIKKKKIEYYKGLKYNTIIFTYKKDKFRITDPETEA